MRKKLAIATLYSNAVDLYIKQIKQLFNNKIDVIGYCFDDGTIESGIDADLVLITSHSIFGVVKKYVKNNSEIIIANRTFTKNAINKLSELEDGTKAMLVNYSVEVAMETISLIYQFGLKNLELVPIYPNMNNVPKINLAITPGESKYVPEFVERIIDIGGRVIDISSIINIAIKLGCDDVLMGEEFRQYSNEILPINDGLESIIGKTYLLQSEISSILKILDEGIIGINKDGIINYYNKSANDIIGLERERLIGHNANKVLPQIPFDKVFLTSEQVKEKLIKINETYLVVSIIPILNMNSLSGAIATVRRFVDTEKKQHKFRTQIIGKGHIAKYTFDNIKGKSEAINKCKDVSRRMVKSESSILITGESGTGKELFAQAIHNHSNRKDYQFVAVNCAALPENLLESELFGYEEGAFSGARKGGKLGLFELAHKGTLFLDEIGEIPLKVQVRLLRVLQEKEVMRIGGDSLIKVDVRIITATNRNLKESIDRGEFRKDLYYRLNVLPLNIPSLRERKEDIFILIDEFKKEYGFNFKINEETKKLFLLHHWEGNIRELRNYVEYLGYLNKIEIDINDVPIGMNEKNKRKKTNSSDKIIIERFKNVVGNHIQQYIYVLEKLEESYIKKERIGRRSIAKKASEEGLFISEDEARKILITLEKYNMVNILKGRGGTRITNFGMHALNQLTG